MHETEEDWHDTTVWEKTKGKKGDEYEGIEKDSFVRDGYVTENYDGKILFILKEANILKYRSNEICIHRNRSQVIWYKNFYNSPHRDNSPKQLEKISRMYCGLANNNWMPSDIEIHSAINNIAFVNLNKRGGDNVDKKVNLYVKKYLEFVRKQIEILEPEYIVCCGTYLYLKQICPDYARNNKLIDMWHTAYTVNRYTHIDMDKYMLEFRNRVGNIS
jgi:hypothetical protein